MRMRFTLLLIGMLVIATTHAQSPMQNMKKYEGNWKADVLMWMSPSTPSMTDHVKAHTEMIMNNLFLIIHYTGTVMETPYEGTETLAYDLQRNVYINTFIDNMNSGIQYTEGTASADGKNLELHGKTFDGNSNKEVPLRKVFTFTDDSHQKIEFFVTTNGTENKTMEIDLVRE